MLPTAAAVMADVLEWTKALLGREEREGGKGNENLDGKCLLNVWEMKEKEIEGI